MISAIVLAAGMSTRLERPKQLLPVKEKTMIESVVENLVAADIDEVIVVVGHEANKVCKLLRSKEVRIIYNQDYELGQSTSLIKGLQVIDDDSKGILCMLGDQPLVKVETLNRLIAEFNSGGELIVLPEYNGRRGNPAIFSFKLKREMMEVTGDVGARSLINKYQRNTKRVDVSDQGVIFDIDTEEDYKELLNLIKKRRE